MGVVILLCSVVCYIVRVGVGMSVWVVVGWYTGG